MGENSKIFVVANQKGGVGKSTVCMALANYLAVEMKFNVGGIIDTDFQSSVFKKRANDMERIKGTTDYPAYEVTSFNLDNYDKIPDLIKELRKTNRFYIFDTPGRLNHQGIVALVSLADYIIIPFNYHDLILKSTIEFIIFYNNIKEQLFATQSYRLSNKLLFLPMMKDERIGTVADKQIWEAISKAYLKTGIILPKISYLKKMQSIDTIKLKKDQLEAVSDSFYSILDLIYNAKENNGESANAES